MNILALLHSPRPSGNDTTIRRIAAHLSAGGHRVTLVPAPDDTHRLARVAKENETDLLIGTHALFSGEAFLKLDLPYLLIFAGTDLNEFSLEEEYLTVMTEAVERASGLIALNENFLYRCLSLWPQTQGKVHHIPQAVWTKPSAFSLREKLGLAPEAEMFLLPSGLRPVKDPLFLFRAVSSWHEENPRVHLVITGTSYDPDFEGIVLRRIASSRGITYAGVLPPEDLHASMREATALVNSSLSECSPNAVLEAMELKCPVLVRDIPGNACLVEHDDTGLVFATPGEFREQAQRLVSDPARAERLGQRGQDFARKFHGVGEERAAYSALIDSLGISAPPSVPLENRSPMREHIVQADGVDICVETFGAPQDPAVLLMAGASDSMLVWHRDFCRRLADGGRYVVRYDHRDTGRSTSYPAGRPPYTLQDLAADTTALLDRLDINTAHFVGMSLGGMLAQLAAINHPDRVTSLTLLSSSPGVTDPYQPDLPSPTLRLSIALDDIPEPDWSDRAAVTDHLVATRRCLASSTRAFDEAAARQLAGEIFDRAPDVLPATRNHLVMDRGEPWRPRLGGIKAPTLVIHGVQDEMYRMAHAEALAAEIPHAKLFPLDDAGHELARADWENVITAMLQHTS
ncbi:alpha/beta fold hydrolase [Streptomyces albofaciens JCM 4342]|uniref:alpha/beta fold hydrolase n=1 Tax=Streptomyces albofaciens TaxID=66866 RepID=UPI00123AA311|nr:alpha/beta fold hydrolase [Streptomyces albofaciens]KAA6212722.1 alpha/beta fold hydrolase [Streptomyces albofaciens JCM 4342]